MPAPGHQMRSRDERRQAPHLCPKPGINASHPPAEADGGRYADREGIERSRGKEGPREEGSGDSRAATSGRRPGERAFAPDELRVARASARACHGRGSCLGKVREERDLPDRDPGESRTDFINQVLGA
jgi:hypothetical protein